MIASRLGGSGTDYENLATCSRTANSGRMDTSTPQHRHSNMAKWEADVFDASAMARAWCQSPSECKRPGMTRTAERASTSISWHSTRCTARRTNSGTTWANGPRPIG
ncbi:hypothetical protein [Streptomyces sp. Mg1]|uniref:hypothetical protein n=1 Tax=Streptomyces sp. Mg1 TaxID=465541 RepID=UPI003FA75D90